MVMRRAILLLALLFPATAAAAVDISTGSDGPVAEYAGIIAFSVHDSHGNHLTIQRPGGDPERLAVVSRDTPFDVDIGPDSHGDPELIYSRCENGVTREGCDLFILSLKPGATERQVNNANASESDLAPTLWQGRIAWARVYPGGTGAVVYSKRTYTKTTGPHRVDGFADAGDALWETQSCDGGENTGCHVVRVTPPAYASTKAPR